MLRHFLSVSMLLLASACFLVLDPDGLEIAADGGWHHDAPAPDSGPSQDAGLAGDGGGLVELDAGSSEDAGNLEDAGEPQDAGESVDAGFIEPDAGVLDDAGGLVCPSGMAPVPGGTFVPSTWDGGVRIEPFCLDLIEVPVTDYRVCAELGYCDDSPADDGCNLPAGRETHPMNCVDRLNANRYCVRLGKRLPAESELEWAARGANAGTLYPWGDQAPSNQLCWSGPGNSSGGTRHETCPVATHPTGMSPQQIYDLSGGVREWTSEDEVSGAVNRGGSWASADPAEVSATARSLDPISTTSPEIGFRCAK